MADEANQKSVFVKLRRKYGLTQKDVADALGVSEQTIRNWENGRTKPQLTIPQTKALCNLLDLELDAIPDHFGPIDGEEPDDRPHYATTTRRLTRR